MPFWVVLVRLLWKADLSPREAPDVRRCPQMSVHGAPVLRGSVLVCPRKRFKINTYTNCGSRTGSVGKAHDHHQIAELTPRPAAQPTHVPVAEAGAHRNWCAKAQKFRFQWHRGLPRSTHSWLGKRTTVKLGGNSSRCDFAGRVAPRIMIAQVCTTLFGPCRYRAGTAPDPVSI